MVFNHVQRFQRLQHWILHYSLQTWSNVPENSALNSSLLPEIWDPKEHSTEYYTLGFNLGQMFRRIQLWILHWPLTLIKVPSDHKSEFNTVAFNLAQISQRTQHWILNWPLTLIKVLIDNRSEFYTLAFKPWSNVREKTALDSTIWPLTLVKRPRDHSFQLYTMVFNFAQIFQRTQHWIIHRGLKLGQMSQRTLVWFYTVPFNLGQIPIEDHSELRMKKENTKKTNVWYFPRKVMEMHFTYIKERRLWWDFIAWQIMALKEEDTQRVNIKF